MRLRSALALSGSSMLAVGALILSPFAAAQETGTRVDMHKAQVTSVTATSALSVRQVLLSFGRCQVANHPRLSSQLLARDPVPNSDALIANIATADCLTAGELRFKAFLLRGSMFVAALRRDFGKGPINLAKQPFDFGPTLAATEPDRESKLAKLAFAGCVARADAEAARTAVLSAPGLPQEQRAYDALSPHLGSCLQKGSQVSLSKTVLQGILAEALYRELAVATPGSPS